MSYFPDVANIAALRSVNTSSLPDNARIRVLSLLQEFWFDKESNAPPDNISLVLPFSPAPVYLRGRWIRNPLPVPEWTAKREWHQDSFAGNDENSGDDGSPVKTMAEITRRLRRVDGAIYTIHQHKAVISTDSVRFSPEISDKGASFFGDTQTIAKILIKGVTEPAKTPRSFSAITGTNPITNTQATVTDTDASFDWSKHVGAILKVTSGAAKNAQAVVLKDLSAEATGRARVSEWALLPEGKLSVATPVANDTYEILELPKFSAPILYAGLPSRVELGFQDVTVSPPPPPPSPSSGGVIPSAATATFTSCRFEVPLPGPPAGFPFQCFLRACSIVFKDPTNFCQTAAGDGPRFTACGLVKARIQVSAFGRTTITDTVIQGGAIRGVDVANGRIFGGLIVVAGKVGVFDSPLSSPPPPPPAPVPGPESAVTLRRGMTMQIQKGGKLYGSGNAVFGVEVSEGATLAIQADEIPTITGKDGDVQLEGVPNAIPGLVEDERVPKAEPLSTWAEWNDPEKRFARNVFNYMTGSRIISTL